VAAAARLWCAQNGIFFQRATPVGVARFLLISFSCFRFPAKVFNAHSAYL
jgi:hypothetical protein